jgi:hypothetical protein
MYKKQGKIHTRSTYQELCHFYWPNTPQPTTPNTYYQTPTVETQQSISTPQEKKIS